MSDESIIAQILLHLYFSVVTTAAWYIESAGAFNQICTVAGVVPGQIPFSSIQLPTTRPGESGLFLRERHEIYL